MWDLWRRADQLATAVSETDWKLRWDRAVRRSATVLEPAWPRTDYAAGPSDAGVAIHALPSVALLLYAGGLNSEPDEVPVEQLVAALTPRPLGASEPPIEDVVRDGLAEYGHELDDGSPLSKLVRNLTVYRPAYGAELPGTDNWPGGTLMGQAAGWVAHQLTYHYLAADSSA